MRDTFAGIGFFCVLLTMAVVLAVVLHYGYGKVQGWRKKRKATKCTLEPQRTETRLYYTPPNNPLRGIMSAADIYPRPMSCQPSKGWIKESRFTVYATNAREAIDALTSLETVDDE